MSALYIHIPYCKQACIYCDFHFSTNTKNQKAFLEALLKEIYLTQNQLQQKKLQSIYFGGGTPSLLSEKELTTIFSTIRELYKIDDHCEITLEANPDDLTSKKLEELQQAGVNRLSIGIQSFIDEHLMWMNRAHSSAEAIHCIQEAQKRGFQNISVDLIYGIPEMTMEQWEHNIQQVLAFGVPHISAYNLTVEPQTQLYHLVNKRALRWNEDKAVDEYWFMCSLLKEHGYKHYEVSNFCKVGKFAKHNSTYWRGGEYLGLGPSAHSYINGKRSYNINNNPQYIKALIHNNERLNTVEELTEDQYYNDYILTRLRAQWGISFKSLKERFSLYENHFHKRLNKVNKNYVEISQEHVQLTEKGMLFSNQIFMELMV